MTGSSNADQPARDPVGGRLLHPLASIDPPKVGPFWLDARVAASPSGVGYTAHNDADRPVLIVMLSEGATDDAAAVDRFAGTIDKMHIDTVFARGGRGQNEGRLGGKYVAQDSPASPDDNPTAPWVALDDDGSTHAVAEAERILAEVDLSWLQNSGVQKGPGYALHWINNTAPGAMRQWPLPWPGKPQRSGWASILISWLIMMLMMALAILIAILLFQSTPPQSAPDPVPNSASASGGSGSPSPQSGSPSPQSGSPSPQSPEPSGSASHAVSSPTPNSKL